MKTRARARPRKRRPRSRRRHAHRTPRDRTCYGATSRSEKGGRTAPPAPSDDARPIRMQGQCALTRRLRGKSPSTHPSIGYDAPCPPRPCGRRGKIERCRARSHERNPRDRTKAIQLDAKKPTMRPPRPNRACGGTDGLAETRDPVAHGGRRRMKRYEIASSRELRSFCMVFVYGVCMPKSAISIPQKKGGLAAPCTTIRDSAS